jgi:cobalt/nickel transport system permease protein
MSCDRRVDSRLRLALAVIASIVIALIDAPQALVWLLAAGVLGCGVTLIAGEAQWRALLRRLLAVNLFLVLVWVTLPFELGMQGLAWSDDGARLAATITARTNAIALAVSALLAGMDAYAVARAGAALGLPVKFARLMLLMVRYVALIGDTWRRLERAARARGFVARADRRSLAVLAQMLALLLVHALLRAERVELALRARAFSGAFGRATGGTVPRAHWAWAAGTTVALLVALTLTALPWSPAWTQFW